MLAMTLALTLTANMARADDFDDAAAALNNGDFATAFNLIKPLAERGYADAQYNLGVMYRLGNGVRKDDTKAVRWYRKAADQGYALAQHNLGVMYSKGRGVKKDVKEAVKCWRQAADQGFA